MSENQGTHIYPTLPSPEQVHDLNKVENGTVPPVNGNSQLTEKPFANNSSTIPVPYLENRNVEIELCEKKDYRYFWRRVLNDLTNKNLIPVKILFFFKYATLFVLYPFLTLHMESLGLDVQEIGVIHACVPVIAILGPPVSGVIADRIGNFKIVLVLITLVNAAVSLLLLLIPVGRETVTLSTNITFDVTCDSLSHQFILNSIDANLCSMNSAEFNNIPPSVVQCGQLCHADKVSNESSTLLKRSVLFGYESLAFYPTFGLKPTFSCGDAFSRQECSFTTIYENEKSSSHNDPLQHQQSEISFSRLVLISDEHLIPSLDQSMFNITQPRFKLEGPITLDNNSYENLTCNLPESVGNHTGNDSQLNDCTTKCVIQLERKRLCHNDVERKEYDVSLTFGLYILFRLLLGFASATSFIMFEGAVLAILKQYGGDYGLQRVSATFAAIIAAPLSGFLLQNYSFRPIFYLYAALKLFSAFLTLKIDLKFKKPAENVLGHLKDVLSQVEILIFFVAMLISGTAWGYLETFLFLFLKSLGGSQVLMGLTITVGGIFGLPLLIFSRPIIKKLGHVNVLCIGLLFYGIRYFGYSTIQNPWMCLFFEALESITASLAITAAATYAVALSTLQTIATIQGIMGALYFGIGRGAGSLLGGISIKHYGHHMTFQIFGIGSFIACILYVLINIFYLRRHSKASSGIDINNMNGLVISNGSAKLNSKGEHIQMKQKPANFDSSLGFGKINPGFEEGDVSEDKFTDIPLDEETQSVPKHRLNNNNSKSS